ncbi:MAG: pilus assembly protein PilM [Deltaproteobacteria bacterium]|nr:pilus assembly protein PilM [Deltaproteobacteria bacterium]
MVDFLLQLKSCFWDRFRNSVILGLDLDSTGGRMVRVTGKGDLVHVTHWQYPEVIDGGDQNSLERFREWIQKEGLSGMPVACSLNDNSLKIRRADLPKMPDFDLKEAVKWQLRDLVEDSIDHYVVRYTVLEEYSVNEADRLALLVYAVKKEAVTRLGDLLKKLSLKPVLIEPTPVAILASLDRFMKWEPGVFYGILNWGNGPAGFYVVSEEKLYFSRPIQETEGNIAVEVQRSLDAFSLVFKEKKVETLLLCGGSGAKPGLVDELSKNLGMSVACLNPFQGWEIADEAPCRYATATGLALYRP